MSILLFFAGWSAVGVTLAIWSLAWALRSGQLDDGELPKYVMFRHHADEVAAGSQMPGCPRLVATLAAGVAAAFTLTLAGVAVYLFL